jgi:hypothetical protein
MRFFSTLGAASVWGGACIQVMQRGSTPLPGSAMVSTTHASPTPSVLPNRSAGPWPRSTQRMKPRHCRHSSERVLESPRVGHPDSPLLFAPGSVQPGSLAPHLVATHPGAVDSTASSSIPYGDVSPGPNVRLRQSGTNSSMRIYSAKPWSCAHVFRARFAIRLSPRPM